MLSATRYFCTVLELANKRVHSNKPTMCRYRAIELPDSGQISLRYPALELARELARELVRELVCVQLASWIA